MELGRHDDSDEDAAHGRHEDMIETVVAQLPCHILDAFVGSDGPRRRRHRTFHRSVRGERSRGRLDRTDHDIARTEDGDCVPQLAECRDVADGRGDLDRSGALHVLRDPTRITDLAFGRHPERSPRRAAADQIVHIRETEQFEPTRGPGAEVSMLIKAVDHGRCVRVERSERRIAVEGVEREADSAGQVLLFVDRARKHVDELRTLLHEGVRSERVGPFGHDRRVPPMDVEQTASGCGFRPATGDVPFQYDDHGAGEREFDEPPSPVRCTS
jgi:hypothetical protein